MQSGELDKVPCEWHHGRGPCQMPNSRIQRNTQDHRLARYVFNLEFFRQLDISVSHALELNDLMVTPVNIAYLAKPGVVNHLCGRLELTFPFHWPLSG